jgi:hypothetical protein
MAAFPRAAPRSPVRFDGVGSGRTGATSACWRPSSSADTLASCNSPQAALCAVRIVKRVPDLIENFVGKAKSLLQDRNHGVLLAGVTLVIDMCNLDEECRDEFRKVSVAPEHT